MTLCARCFRDKPSGAVNAAGDWECGSCNPDYAVGRRANRGGNAWTPNKAPIRQR